MVWMPGTGQEQVLTKSIPEPQLRESHGLYLSEGEKQAGDGE